MYTLCLYPLMGKRGGGHLSARVEPFPRNCLKGYLFARKTDPLLRPVHPLARAPRF